jgi:hypothetical protein
MTHYFLFGVASVSFLSLVIEIKVDNIPLLVVV